MGTFWKNLKASNANDATMPMVVKTATEALKNKIPIIIFSRQLLWFLSRIIEIQLLVFCIRAIQKIRIQENVIAIKNEPASK